MRNALPGLIFALIVPLSVAEPVFADGSQESELPEKSPKERLFTVSSDELDNSESLNRIAGQIDLGFSAPSQSFRSPDHYPAGPFSQEKENESS